jgi:hypothetical protein
MTTEDLNACFADIGSLLLWEKDPNRKGRVLVKVRVTDILDIPKSIRMTESSRPDAESWTFSVEVLLNNLLGGGPADEDPLPDEGVDPHPLPGHALPAPVFNPAPVDPVVQDNQEDDAGWGHWAMGVAENLPQPMEVEEQAPVQQEEMVLDDQHQDPPLLDTDSFINVSSSNSEDTATHDPQGVGSSSAPIQQGQHENPQQSSAAPTLPLGDGLLNILQAYSAHDDLMADDSENGLVESSLPIPSSQVLEDDLFLPANVNVVPPNEAHLQLTLGKVQTYFTPIPAEHDLSTRFSTEGLALWEKY